MSTELKITTSRGNLVLPIAYDESEDAGFDLMQRVKNSGVLKVAEVPNDVRGAMGIVRSTIGNNRFASDEVEAASRAFVAAVEKDELRAAHANYLAQQVNEAVAGFTGYLVVATRGLMDDEDWKHVKSSKKRVYGDALRLSTFNGEDSVERSATPVELLNAVLEFDREWN